MKRNTFTLLLVFLTIPVFSQDMMRHSLDSKTGIYSEGYQSFTFNGSWTWFSDPRAVYYEGEHKRTYAGWIDNYGDVTIAYFDHKTQTIQSSVVYDNLEIDDHNNPSILFDETGRLLVFFNKHNGGMYLIKSTSPESISAWTEVRKLELNDSERYPDGRDSYTYTHPFKLSAEKKALKVWLQFLPNPEWGLRLIPATFQSIQEILTFRNLIQQNTSTND
jgi:hypothetical protein